MKKPFYIHILTYECPISYAYLRFFEKHFDYSNCLFIIRANSMGMVYSDEFKKHIIYINGLYKFIFRLIPMLYKCDIIYLHFFSASPYLYLWFIFKNLFKKTAWILWGGDLYYYHYRKHDLKNNIYEYIRSKIIKIFPVISCTLKEDYVMVKKLYNTDASYICIGYPLPENLDHLDEILNNNKDSVVKHDEFRIIIGNSADRANDHLGIFEFLKQFKDENLIIQPLLSYGIDKPYLNDVIKAGEEIFGSKFSPVLDFMNPPDFAHLILNSDMLIVNHQRQQGLGTIGTFLYLKKKVYLRFDTTTYASLSAIGMKLFDISKIKSESFDQFVSFDKQAGDFNHDLMRENYSNEKLIVLWKNLFDVMEKRITKKNTNNFQLPG